KSNLANSVAAMSPAYASPEMFQGQASHHADQYSLAITYCQLRGGRLPFEGSPLQIMNGHLSEPPNLSMVPAFEHKVLARALSKDPKQRWPNCRAFAAALAAAQESVEPPPTKKRWRDLLLAVWPQIV